MFGSENKDWATKAAALHNNALNVTFHIEHAHQQFFYRLGQGAGVICYGDMGFRVHPKLETKGRHVFRTKGGSYRTSPTVCTQICTAPRVRVLNNVDCSPPGRSIRMAPRGSFGRKNLKRTETRSSQFLTAVKSVRNCSTRSILSYSVVSYGQTQSA